MERKHLRKEFSDFLGTNCLYPLNPDKKGWLDFMGTIKLTYYKVTLSLPQYILIRNVVDQLRVIINVLVEWINTVIINVLVDWINKTQILYIYILSINIYIYILIFYSSFGFIVCCSLNPSSINQREWKNRTKWSQYTRTSQCRNWLMPWAKALVSSNSSEYWCFQSGSSYCSER